MAEQGGARPQRSLRSRLLLRVLLPLAVTWSIGSAVAFSLSWVLAGRAFDRALLDDAAVIAANVVERDGSLVLNLTPHEIETLLYDQDDYEYFAVYDASGRAVAGNADLASIGVATLPGGALRDATLAGEAIRVTVLRNEGARPFVVAVGETTRSRTRPPVRPAAALARAPGRPAALLGWLLWRRSRVS
jgi:two-component system sensor histidine kinase TctE